MGFVEGKLGFVVASYLVAGGAMALLALWVGWTHRVRRREIAALEGDEPRGPDA